MPIAHREQFLRDSPTILPFNKNALVGRTEKLFLFKNDRNVEKNQFQA